MLFAFATIKDPTFFHFERPFLASLHEPQPLSQSTRYDAALLLDAHLPRSLARWRADLALMFGTSADRDGSTRLPRSQILTPRSGSLPDKVCLIPRILKSLPG